MRFVIAFIALCFTSGATTTYNEDPFLITNGLLQLAYELADKHADNINQALDQKTGLTNQRVRSKLAASHNSLRVKLMLAQISLIIESQIVMEQMTRCLSEIADATCDAKVSATNTALRTGRMVFIQIENLEIMLLDSERLLTEKWI